MTVNTPIQPYVPLSHPPTSQDIEDVQNQFKNVGLHCHILKDYRTKNIRRECRLRIDELKARNQEILPKKLHQGRITLLGVGSSLALITGIALTILGIALSCSGVGLPAGLALIAIGIGSIAFSIPCLKYFNNKIKLHNEVKQNRVVIKTLKKVINDDLYKEFLRDLHKELGVDHLSVPAFVIKYDTQRFYELFCLFEEKKKKPNPDPTDSYYKDHSYYFNFIEAKFHLTNQMLQQLDKNIRKLDQAILKNSSKNPANIPILQECRQVFLKRAKSLKKAREGFLRDAPKTTVMSRVATFRFQKIQRFAQQTFSSVDAGLIKRN